MHYRNYWCSQEHLETLNEIESTIRKITPNLKLITKSLAFMLVDGTKTLCFADRITKKGYLADKDLNPTNQHIPKAYFIGWVTYEDL